MLLEFNVSSWRCQKQQKQHGRLTGGGTLRTIKAGAPQRIVALLQDQYLNAVTDPSVLRTTSVQLSIAGRGSPTANFTADRGVPGRCTLGDSDCHMTCRCLTLYINGSPQACCCLYGSHVSGSWSPELLLLLLLSVADSKVHSTCLVRQYPSRLLYLQVFHGFHPA